MNLRFILIFFIVFPLAGYTQSEANSFSNLAEEVIVTARKREENSQSVPISISAYTGETIEQIGIYTYEDLDRISPNLQVIKNGAFGTAAVTIRGVGGSGISVTSESQAATYVDGVYVPRTQGNFLDLWDLERVEVLKGPQGTLFGKNSTVGAVSFFYNKPNFDSQNYKMRVGVGSDSRNELALMANLPVSDLTSLRFSYSQEKQDGYIYNTTRNEFSGAIDAETIRLSGVHKFSNDLDIFFSHVNYNRDGNRVLGACEVVAHPLNGIGAAGINGSAFMGLAFVADPSLAAAIQANCNSSVPGVSGTSITSPRVDDNLKRTTVDATYKSKFGELKLIFNHSDLESLNGSLGLSVNGNRPPNALPAGGQTSASYLDPRDIVNNATSNQIELRWSGKAFNEKLDFVVGVYTFDESGINQLDTMYFDGVGTDETQNTVNARANAIHAATFGALGNDCDNPGTNLTVIQLCSTVQSLQALSSQQTTFAENKSDAFFFEGTYAINPDTNITFGYRFTTDDKMVQTYSDAIIPGLSNGFGGLRSPAAGACTQTFNAGTTIDFGPFGTFQKNAFCKGIEEFENDSFRLALDYTLPNGSLLYASYAKGFASGGFNNDDRVSAFPAETADNYEIGTKGVYLDGKLQVNANIFIFDYINNQRSIARIDPNSGAASIATVPIQKAEVDGYEIEMKAFINDYFSFLISRGAYGGKYKEFVDDNGNDLTGYAYDAEGPESRTNITLFNNFSFNSKTISSSLSWTHVGDDFTTTELYDYSQLHNYSTLDFTSSIQISDSQTLTLVGKNITDELYGYAQFGDPVLASIQTTYYAPGEEWKLTYQQSF
tara:strand:- start:339 stop:2834 length:2496 start_codon:yes stop_codon:yes gene_type:complete